MGYGRIHSGSIKCKWDNDMIQSKRFCSSLLAIGPASLYSPTNVKAVIQSMSISNTTSNPVNCSVWLVPAGGTPDNTNNIWSAQQLAAGEHAIVAEAIAQVIDIGGAIYAQGAGLTLVASGTETNQ